MLLGPQGKNELGVLNEGMGLKGQLTVRNPQGGGERDNRKKKNRRVLLVTVG